MEFLTKENKERDEIWVHENEFCYDKITLTHSLSCFLSFSLLKEMKHQWKLSRLLPPTLLCYVISLLFYYYIIMLHFQFYIIYLLFLRETYSCAIFHIKAKVI